MKMKYIAGAIAAIAAAQAHAVVLDISTQAPQVTVYVSGASAQKTAFEAVVANAVCVTPADVVKLTDGAGTSSKGWYCVGKGTAAGQRVLILNRTKGGSASGINMVLSTAATPVESEADTIDSGSCAAPVAKVSACTLKKKVESTMALSDVHPSEFGAGVLGSGAGYLSIGSLTTAAVGLQGFGVAVNPNMYLALQEQNIADGRLPSTCTAGDVTAACQPTISSSEYASLAAVAGGPKDAASLLPLATTTGDLTLCRRVDTSGTQASSNLFFLNNVCGSKGYFGSETPAKNADYGSAPFTVVDNSETDNVKACLNDATGLRMGVISLENDPATDVANTINTVAPGIYKFVKIDGVSPNYTAAGVADAKQKANTRNGSYKFAVESYALYKGSAVEKAVAKQIADSLKSSISDLRGVLSLTGTGSTSALYTRGGNNCAPLMQR